MNRHRHRLRPLTLLCFALALLGMSRPVAAGGETVIYAMRERGRVYVNSTLFEILPGKFNLNNLLSPHGPERWTDLAVVGSDRYELRLDGRIEKNGALFLELPFFVSNFSWSHLHVDGTDVYALRTDGVLAFDDGATVEFDKGIYEFYDIAVLAGRVYVLRGDGAVFVDDQTDPVINFQGKKNKLDTDEGKGSFGASIWQRLVTDPTTSVLVALRGDGQLQQWAPGDAEATILEDLPFPKKSEKVRSGHRYIDLEIDAGGTRYVLRRDGRVYDTSLSDEELVDWPGKTKTRKRSEGFVDLALLDGTFMGVRWDGHFFQGLSTDLVVDLPGKRYVRLAASNSAPDQTSFNNSIPVAAVYSAKAVEGMPLSIPLIATDVDKAESDLVITPDLSGLPPGVTYDAGTRTVNWADPGPTGKYTFDVSVNDGFGSSPTVFTYKIDVRSANIGGKNTKPLVSTVAPVQALVGIPFVLPILAVDREGDALTVTPDEGKGAFGLGAVYDDGLGAFVWTAAFENVGKTSARLRVSDGNKTRSLTVKIEVMNPIIFGDG